jgi:hypothetical protein
VKDKANDCPLFAPRVTIARDGVSSNGHSAPPPSGPPTPRNADDARSAFDRLFKKP